MIHTNYIGYIVHEAAHSATFEIISRLGIELHIAHASLHFVNRVWWTRAASKHTHTHEGSHANQYTHTHTDRHCVEKYRNWLKLMTRGNAAHNENECNDRLLISSAVCYKKSSSLPHPHSRCPIARSVECVTMCASATFIFPFGSVFTRNWL